MKRRMLDRLRKMDALLSSYEDHVLAPLPEDYQTPLPGTNEFLMLQNKWQTLMDKFVNASEFIRRVDALEIKQDSDPNEFADDELYHFMKSLTPAHKDAIAVFQKLPPDTLRRVVETLSAHGDSEKSH